MLYVTVGFRALIASWEGGSCMVMSKMPKWSCRRLNNASLTCLVRIRDSITSSGMRSGAGVPGVADDSDHALR